MTDIEKELSRLEAETGKSRSTLFREWFKAVSVEKLRTMQEKDKSAVIADRDKARSWAEKVSKSKPPRYTDASRNAAAFILEALKEGQADG